MHHTWLKHHASCSLCFALSSSSSLSFTTILLAFSCDCFVCISTGCCGCCRCSFCCCSMACRRCAVLCGLSLLLFLLVVSVSTSPSSPAAVQSDLVVWVVVHVFFSSWDPLHQLIIISLISFSAGDAIRRCSFAQLIADALCETDRLLPSTPTSLASPSQRPCD